MFGKNGTYFLSAICTQVAMVTMHRRIPNFTLGPSIRSIPTTQNSFVSFLMITLLSSPVLYVFSRPTTAYLGIQDRGPSQGFPVGCTKWLWPLLDTTSYKQRVLCSCPQVLQAHLRLKMHSTASNKALDRFPC